MCGNVTDGGGGATSADLWTEYSQESVGRTSPTMSNITGVTRTGSGTSETSASSQGLTRTTVSRTSLRWRRVLCPAGEGLEHGKIRVKPGVTRAEGRGHRGDSAPSWCKRVLVALCLP